MADEEETAVADGEATEAPAKRKAPLLFVMIGGVILLLVIAAVAAFLLLGKQKRQASTTHEAGSSMEIGGHIDNADENAQRAAALARAAADGAAPATNAAGPKP